MDESGNINSALRLMSDDFKYTAKFNVFNGRIDLAIFDKDVKGAPIVKSLFTPTSAVQFKMILDKILNDKEAAPIEIGFFPFNRDSKTEEFRSSITVGRDKDKVIYFDMCGDKHKDPIRMATITDRSMRINGMELPKQSLSEAGARTIREFMGILLQAALYVKDKPFTPNGSGEFASNGGGNGAPLPPPIGDDVPF